MWKQQPSAKRLQTALTFCGQNAPDHSGERQLYYAWRLGWIAEVLLQAVCWYGKGILTIPILP